MHGRTDLHSRMRRLERDLLVARCSEYRDRRGVFQQRIGHWLEDGSVTFEGPEPPAETRRAGNWPPAGDLRDVPVDELWRRYREALKRR
jgi:hypothetical protein